ncbi:histidine phosphotransferase family protein [Oceanibium sediminis]|uniref:histidine phosphotransferase family protein n=1 Tax=Oceanibium sediminis TaxID=2026339 RepID=UPI000DD2D719|nr:histidine phosphotransferase family protein [Oceanibium sediminis]
MGDQDISALVSSRICHDLISPIGAISNGVELLTGSGGPITPELGLIGDSVNSATEKLRCFRIAFGAADAGAALPMSEVRNAVSAMFQGRSSVTLTGPDGDVPRILAKAFLLTLLCQERMLPLGGHSRATLLPDGFTIETEATRQRDISGLWAVVDTGDMARDLAPAEVQFLLLGQLLRDRGTQLQRDITPTTITLGLRGL